MDPADEEEEEEKERQDKWKRENWKGALFKYRYFGGISFVDLVLILGTAVSMFEELAVLSFDSIDGMFYRNS